MIEMAAYFNTSELDGPESSSDEGDAELADEFQKAEEVFNTSDLYGPDIDSSDEFRTSELDGADTPTSSSQIPASIGISAAAKSPSTSMQYLHEPHSIEEELECYLLPQSDEEESGCSSREPVEESASKKIRLSEEGKSTLY